MHSKLLPDYCYSGRALSEVGGVVIHYFSAKNVDEDRMFELEACFELFKDLNRARNQREHYMLGGTWPERRMYASAHYLIGRDGTTWQLIEPTLQAYHAGRSRLGALDNLNTWTLGVELVGHNTSKFTQLQYLSLVTLLCELEERFGFPRDHVVGHDTVRSNAILAGETGPGGRPLKKKYDPSGAADGQGDNFDWFYLGKLWNDRRPNPAGTTTLEDLEDVIAADPQSG